MKARRSVGELRAAFRQLHTSGCFILPNPWDVGSARLMQHLGFQAVASTSSGFAWSTGRPDYGVSRADVLQHLGSLCNAVDLPVNADFESGFGEDPAGVAESVTLAIDTGVAGLSIEDRDIDADEKLYDLNTALERLRAARTAIGRSGQDVILVARTEGLLIDPRAVTPAIDRLVAFAEAGADCLYAPGVVNKEDITAMVRAVAPKPINVLMMRPGLMLSELSDLGVRRISVGGALARVALGVLIAAAEKMKAGSFDGLGGAAKGDVLNSIFRDFEDVRR
ncbi:MAG TPA: isocitrate lyase/phosphoenolpyruvate mutase family protein [Gemmatimonadaceae bacterium]